MNKVTVLRIEILKEEIEKLVKDFQDIASKRIRESNPQERNNLQLQLDDIAKQIEEKEQQLETIGKNLEKDNIQNLLNLLIPYKDEISSCVKRAYQSCSPDDWPNPLPENLEGILAELKKMKQGESRYTVLEKFIARLVLDSEIPQPISQQLKTWAESNITGYLELINAILTQKKESTNQNSYLIVVVRRSEQDSSSHANKEDCYFVNAWLIPDGDNYQRNSVCKQLFYFPDATEIKKSKVKNEKTLTFKQIPKAINFFLNEIGEYSSHKLTIEIFLPLDLINEAVDNWEIENEFGIILKLSDQYKVVVRSTERVLPTYSRYHGFWQQKWLTLQKIIKEPVISNFVLWDDDDLRRLLFELNKENTIGIKLQKTPRQTGKGSVFAVILSTATPVALWLRCHLPSECNQQINGLLRCCIEQLTKTVAEKRREAIPEPEDSHIGHHLALLWEDPYRLPPSIDYSM